MPASAPMPPILGTHPIDRWKQVLQGFVIQELRSGKPARLDVFGEVPREFRVPLQPLVTAAGHALAQAHALDGAPLHDLHPQQRFRA